MFSSWGYLFNQCLVSPANIHSTNIWETVMWQAPCKALEMQKSKRQRAPCHWDGQPIGDTHIYNFIGYGVTSFINIFKIGEIINHNCLLFSK